MSNQIVLMVLRQGRPISTYPTVVNAARLWKAAGWQVVIITGTTLDVPDLFATFINFTSRKFLFQMWQVIAITLRCKPGVVIAYEPIDAELCVTLSHLHQARYIYHNIELRYAGNRFFAIHHVLEKHFYQQSDTVICQDSLRMGELKKLLGQPASGTKEYLVPNTYMREQLPEENRFWHKKFTLKNTHKILLYAGSIQRTKMPIEVIQRLLAVMPDDWSLALWGWSVDGYVDEITKSHAAELIHKRLIVITDTLPEKYFNIAVYSASAGLVWHETTSDLNEYNIGLSSGKFWRFVTLGKPVIVVDRPGLSDFVLINNIGLVVENINKIQNNTLYSIVSQEIELKSTYFYSFYYTKIVRSY